MNGWMGREITWKLHFPLELLLSAPFGSSVGKPDLRKGRNEVAGCALHLLAPTALTTCSWPASEHRPFLRPDIFPSCSGLCCPFSTQRLEVGKERRTRRLLSLISAPNDLFPPYCPLLHLTRTQSLPRTLYPCDLCTLCGRAHSPSLCPRAKR